MHTVVVASRSALAASAVARRVAAEGAAVAVLAPGKHDLTFLAADLIRLGARAALAIACDVTVMRDVEEAADRVEADVGPIDRWVNTALTDHGFVCATRVALDLMQPRDRGTIVQLGASRAVRMFTHGARNELRTAGSHVRLEIVRTHPFRRAGAAVIAGATVVGAMLLRRIGR